MNRRTALKTVAGGAASALIFATGSTTTTATAQGIGLSRAFVYHPKDSPGRPWPGLPPFETLTYQGRDGQPLAAWFWRGSQPAGTPLTVFFHGNAGNFEDSTKFTAGLIAAGYPVLLPEYRGYGGLPGKPTETGLRADAQAALDVAQGLGWPASNTIITGHSLGGALAFHALHDQGQTARGAIIMSTFTSLPAMAGLAGWLMADQFDNLALAPQTSVPVAWVHGTRDRLIPIKHGQRLFNALPASTPKTFIPIDVPHAAEHRTYQTAMLQAMQWHLTQQG